jgi:hypothetical protein
MTSEDQNSAARELWEDESLGGITEDNNRLPQPILGLLVLTIITAFLITFPLWGQRPTAALYEDYIKLMDSPAIQGKTDEEAMKYIVSTVKAQGSDLQSELDRHPLSMDDLRMIKDQVIELQNRGAHMNEYTVLGDKLVLANFEGNWREDGTRERVQPWWDKGYTIDIFFIVIFCISVIIVVKRLPGFDWQPTHEKHKNHD